MPTVDTTSITGGYGQIIDDWVNGDDRQFSGDALSSANPPPTGDQNLSDAYFTLKASPNTPDADAVIQVHITQTSTAQGQITNGADATKTALLIKVASGTYQGITNPGTAYYWDIRTITATGGVTQTIADGFVTFIQNVTQTNKTGTPAAFPNSGNPRFRGFSFVNPQTTVSSNVYNQGDFFMNEIPTVGQPIGWTCTVQGSPGTWRAWPNL